ncbi:hypothetical protein OH710_01450 [Pseudomonas capsici]|uniref:hypothetical protein n=1 Tax=Pseudomonas capsici TaxID=2810614 RepID=UPI001C89EE53|nr:hypothetical protein [Pseudomonas capsici]MCV4271295.1 hypothetical protein [Pseudomonas capsici]
MYRLFNFLELKRLQRGLFKQEQYNFLSAITVAKSTHHDNRHLDKRSEMIQPVRTGAGQPRDPISVNVIF